MAEQRYTMKRNGRGLDAEFNEEGRLYLESLRVLRADLFKRARIKEVLQMTPSKLPTRVVYAVGGPVLGCPVQVKRGEFVVQP